MPDFPSRPLSPRARRVLDRATADDATHTSPYRLRRDESTGDGLRRVARDQLADAVANLRNLERDPPVAVHEARKDLKKVRAVLRLTRERLGDDRYGPENRRLRDAGRSLAHARDAEVKIQTLRALGERFGDEAPAAAIDELAASLQGDLDAIATDGDIHALEDAAAEAVVQIEAGVEDVSDWPLEGRGWKLVKDGLVTSYSRGRDAFRETVSNPTPEAVHEWRKRGKDLWYHVRLLRDCWPEVLDPLAHAAHELTDLLGDHHDLEVLAEDVRAPGPLEGDPEAHDALLELIERRQDELLERAIPLGERIYAEKPPEFKRRIRAYWRSWRSD